VPDRLLYNQEEAARLLGVSRRYLRLEADIKPREIPGHGPTGKPLLRYHIDDIKATIAKWHDQQKGRRRA
jgi:hypothetical protein